MAHDRDSGGKFFSCLPCSKRGRTGEAEKYCIQCQEYLCPKCVTSHNSFSALSGHTLVGGPGGIDKRSLPSVPTEICKIHAAKLIDLYCEIHDAVGCSICIYKDHRICRHCYIPEYVENRPIADTAPSIEKGLSKILQNLNVLKKRQQKTREELKEAKEKGTRDVKHYKEELKQIIDRLEHACINEINEKYTELDEKVQKEMKEIEDRLEELTRRKSEIEASGKNLSQIFVSAKICAKSAAQTETRIAEYMKTPNKVLIFVKSSDIFDYLSNKSGLGRVQTLPREGNQFGAWIRGKL